MSGRIRSIKPELLDDEKTSSISHEAFRLFIGLILLADDYGNVRGNPRYLDGAVYHSNPTDTPIEQLLQELATVGSDGLIVRYVVHGQRYVHLRGWRAHQRVDRPGKPRVPSITDADVAETQLGLYPDSSAPEGIVNHSRETHAGSSRDLRETPAEPTRDSRGTLATVPRDSREFVLPGEKDPKTTWGNIAREAHANSQEILATDLRPPTSDLRPPTDDDDRARPIARASPRLGEGVRTLVSTAPPIDGPAQEELEELWVKHMPRWLSSPSPSSPSLEAFSDFDQAALDVLIEEQPDLAELDSWAGLFKHIVRQSPWLVRKHDAPGGGKKKPLTIGWLLRSGNIEKLKNGDVDDFESSPRGSKPAKTDPPIAKVPDAKTTTAKLRQIEQDMRKAAPMPDSVKAQFGLRRVT